MKRAFVMLTVMLGGLLGNCHPTVGMRALPPGDDGAQPAAAASSKDGTSVAVEARDDNAIPSEQAPMTTGETSLTSTLSSLWLSLTDHTVAASVPADGSCATGDFFVKSQADIARLSGVACIDGNLFISDSPLTNLDGLESITRISGALSVESNPRLVNVNGLSGIREVGFVTHVRYNDALEHVDGLRALRTVGENLDISGNKALQHVNGLRHLMRVGTYLSIESNESLVHLEGLSALEQVGEAFSITFNQSLTHIGSLSALREVGALNIKKNLALRHLTGLESLKVVHGNLWLYFNENLESVQGLAGVEKIAGALMIWSCPRLTTLAGMTALSHVHSLQLNNNGGIASLAPIAQVQFGSGYVSISGMDSLVDFSGLEGFSGNISSLWVHDNASLLSLDGLQGISEVKGDVWIYENPQLASVQGIGNIRQVVEKFSIERNPMLSGCAVEALFKRINVVGSFMSVDLTGNKADGCEATYKNTGP